jgi:F0F1-type ATP synthase membrane subunit b/b'
MGRYLSALLVALALLMGGSWAAAEEPEVPPSDDEGERVTAAGQDLAQSEEHDEHGHVPHLEDINLFEGFLGEKEGVQPGLLYRAPGRPPPLGALLINTGLLFFVLIYYGRRPVSEALKKRKASIMHGMDEAARMRAEAEARLEQYERKLERIDHEIERVRREMRETGEAERERILRDARERRERMERDARLVVEQELKEAREILLRETVRAAVRSAEERLSRDVTLADQQLMADEYLTTVKRSAGTLRGSS